MQIFGTALLLAIAAAPAAQERTPRAPQTDQTVPVSRGTRLTVDNFAGEVVVRTWDKDSLRVQARHASRTRVNIRPTPAGVRLSASSPNGPAGSVDYEITAPAWMPMKIEGQFIYVTVEGAQNEVAVETVRGDIVLKGGSGSISAKTIDGEILVEGARGKITVSSVSQPIKVTGASGEITAETTNGSISLARIESSSVEAVTVNGNVVYEGTLADNGRYSFSTHNGDITMTVPETANASFSVRTYNGEFGTSLPLKGPEKSELRRGKRVTYTLGTGSAEVEMESFGGAIRLRRAGAARTGRE
jgi:putative adhesin